MTRVNGTLVARWRTTTTQKRWTKIQEQERGTLHRELFHVVSIPMTVDKFLVQFIGASNQFDGSARYFGRIGSRSATWDVTCTCLLRPVDVRPSELQPSPASTPAPTPDAELKIFSSRLVVSDSDPKTYDLLPGDRAAHVRRNQSEVYRSVVFCESWRSVAQITWRRLETSVVSCEFKEVSSSPVHDR